jgi:hypothetical protein
VADKSIGQQTESPLDKCLSAPSRHTFASVADEKHNKLAPALGPAVTRAIARKLRAMYAYIIVEGVPERFIAILRRL